VVTRRHQQQTQQRKPFSPSIYLHPPRTLAPSCAPACHRPR
jgi:hypothetical protein